MEWNGLPTSAPHKAILFLLFRIESLLGVDFSGPFRICPAGPITTVNKLFVCTFPTGRCGVSRLPSFPPLWASYLEGVHPETRRDAIYSSQMLALCTLTGCKFFCQLLVEIIHHLILIQTLMCTESPHNFRLINHAVVCGEHLEVF